MTPVKRFARRDLLRGAAAVAGGATLAACSGNGGAGGGSGGTGSGGGKDSGGGGSKTPSAKPHAKGSVTKNLPTPKKFQEAPSLTKQVQAGKLPAVEQRIPAHPYVVPHRWWSPGQYGGAMRLISPAADDSSNANYMYGHSLLRYLNDGLDIGPGLLESWDSDEDASTWTLHLREGLRWSDGKPCTTADVMFWWEDMVHNEEHPATPPEGMHSGKGTVATLKAPDDTTLKVSFDTSTPLLPDHLATWVNRVSGPPWIEPRHYLKKFHPRYNKSLSKSWVDDFEVKRNFLSNPDNPTMTGWRLRSFHEGRSAEWVRNPYYWCVDRDGRQLPYVDQLIFTEIQNPEVGKLQIRDGKVDYVHGHNVGLALADISGLKASQSRSGVRVLLWDSGSGSGSTFVLNYDYQDPEFRKVIRDKRFRQALSHAFDRDEARRSIYYNTGEKTTGTMSPKAREYHAGKEGRRIYQEWRDSYVSYDPKKAKKLLDEVGVVDTDGDGVRELPGGGKLTILLQYPADTSEVHIQKNNLLKRNWAKVGIHAQLSPISPTSIGDQWTSGRLMTQTARFGGDGPDHLTYASWLVPIEPNRWAPLEGSFYEVRGTPKANTEKDKDPFHRSPPRMDADPGGPIERLWKLYDRAIVEPDTLKRRRLVYEMIKVHIDEGPFFMGSVAGTPFPEIAHKDLGNVPAPENLAQGGYAAPGIHPTPAVYDPEIYFWHKPEQHA